MPHAPLRQGTALFSDQPSGGGRLDPEGRTSVIVRPERWSIEGWGLARTLVQIEVPDAGPGSAHTISLSTDRGQILPASVLLDENGRANVELRSAGTGIATITVDGGRYGSGTATVGFGFPRRFLSVMVAGAIAGWLVRQRPRRPTVQSSLVAFTSACILGAVYALGIHWLQWAPDNAVGEVLPPLAFAAVGAYWGLTAVAGEGGDRLTGSQTTVQASLARDSAIVMVAGAIRRLAEAAERTILLLEKADEE